MPPALAIPSRERSAKTGRVCLREGAELLLLTRCHFTTRAKILGYVMSNIVQRGVDAQNNLVVQHSDFLTASAL
jgi:hypothetical protein